MTTFQAIIYALVHAVTELCPLSLSAHQILVPYVFDWQPAMGALLGVFELGCLLALLVYFRHDWASMISSLLQVILFRKRPMTLDERIPIFIGITTIPMMFLSYYLREQTSEVTWTPLLVSLISAVIGLGLWSFDFFGRKFKSMVDWKWLDALVVGLIQATAVIPGWDPFTGILIGALFLNYKRESAVKYTYFAIVPILAVQTFAHLKELSFHSALPMPDLSWLSFGTGLIVSFFTGLLTIEVFMKHIQRKGFGVFVAYRWLFSLAVCGLYWYRNH